MNPNDFTNFYLCGGAVRDAIMGILAKDHDYVVVGSSPEEMIELGYRQVGCDFPVFLDINGTEYALARTEKKSGHGYHGFNVDFSKDVTLKMDAARRDFTMNSLYMDDSGKIIDFFEGQDDIKNGIIRHVSDAFKEDPVRILRAARFAARYKFVIAPETLDLCREMVRNGEINHLTSERVALEMTKALTEKTPSIFFEYLDMFGALEILFPEIHALIGQTQPVRYHAEGDSFIHTMMVLDEAAKATDDVLTRFCALTHDLGKGLTPKDKLPHHYGHEAAGAPLVEAMCDRLKLPTEFKRAGCKVAKYHMHIHKIFELNAKTILKMWNDMGKNSHMDDYQILADVSVFDNRGRISENPRSSEDNAEFFMEITRAMKGVKLSNFKTPDEIKSMTVGQIQNFISSEQIRMIQSIKQNRNIV